MTDTMLFGLWTRRKILKGERILRALGYPAAAITDRLLERVPVFFFGGEQLYQTMEMIIAVGMFPVTFPAALTFGKAHAAYCDHFKIK